MRMIAMPASLFCCIILDGVADTAIPIADGR